MTTLRSDFCVFILTHGRPEKVFTYDSLMQSGYTGKVYIVIDDEDKTAKQYKEIYGSNVLVFQKAKVADSIDEGDNFKDRRAIIYARNACFDLAKRVGCKYFMQLDDDYTHFWYKFNRELRYEFNGIRSMDTILEAMLEFYDTAKPLSLAMAQGGDFIGGAHSSRASTVTLFRKCMNSFICSVDNPFRFSGRINEDVNTYTELARRGGLFFTANHVALSQKQTQSNSGGMTELYLDSGTYVKSFYSVMYCPSSVRVKDMGDSYRRLHHSVTWANTTPQIIREEHRK